MKFLKVINISLIISIVLPQLAFSSVKASSSLILNTQSGAVGAYALRKLNANYNGPVIKIRRDCDETTADIGFNNLNFLDEQAIDAFIAGCPASTDTPPLDISANAAGAYSTRKLKSDYNGFAMQIVRSSDSQTMDIGFSSDDRVDQNAIETFCDTTTCFVEIWYDQSGNDNHATPVHGGAYAKVYDQTNGLIFDADGKLSIEADGYNDLYQTGISIGEFYSIFLIATKNRQSPTNWSNGAGTSSMRPLIGNDANNLGHTISIGTYSQDNSILDIRQNDWQTRIEVNNAWQNNEKLHLSVISTGDGGNMLAFKNNQALGSDAVASIHNYGNLYLFGQNTGAFERRFAGLVNEIIFYNSDESANRAALDTAIAAYSLNDGRRAYVETWYDQSGNGNHAIQADITKQAEIYSEFEGGVLHDSHGYPAIKSDGVDDIYPTGININETHGIFAMLSILDQTSGGSTLRPFIGNEDQFNFDNHLGYGVRRGEDNPKARFAFLNGGNVRRYEENNFERDKNKPGLYSILSDENQTSIYLDDELVINLNGNLDRDFNNICLLGELTAGSRRFAGLINEFIIYNESKFNERLAVQNDLAQYYDVYPVNFNGKVSLDYNTMYAFSPIGTLVSRITATNLDSPEDDIVINLTGNDNFRLENDKILVNKVFRDDQIISVKAVNQVDSTFIDRDIFIKVLQRPIVEPPINEDDSTVDNNPDEDIDQSEGEQNENEIIEEETVIIRKYPEQIDRNLNEIIEFDEVVRVISNINKIRRAQRSNISNSEISTLVKELDVNNDGTFNANDITKLNSYAETHRDYKYIVNILAEIGTNKSGQVTFKRANSTLREFRRLVREVGSRVNPRIKYRQSVDLFDYNNNGTLDSFDRNQLEILIQVALEKINSNSKRSNRINRFTRRKLSNLPFDDN